MDTELEEDYRLGSTLGAGRYEIVQHYLGGGADQLWFARNATDPNARYLVSTTYNNGLRFDTDGPGLMRIARGLFTPRFVGAFDLVGDGSDGDIERRSAVGYVEELPAGGPLLPAVADTTPHAWRLGAQIAAKLLTAATDGILDVGLRPEYVWVETRRNVPEVTGVGGQNRAFFAAALRRRDLVTAPLFTRRYVAPEVYRGDPYDDRALVLTVALMTAEWLMGRYPYEDDGEYGYWHLCRGEPLELPADARDLLPALSPAPADRPDLATFAHTLAQLAR